MSNKTFKNAKDAKYDEYYTQYYDIEREIEAYLDYNPNIFRGKTVLLPCDDPEWSNFTRYFAQNFEMLGLKKLISTSYALESKKYRPIAHFAGCDHVQIPILTRVLRVSNVSGHKSTVEIAQWLILQVGTCARAR